MNGTCYCCEDASVGQGDHVPPKKLFAPGAFAFVRPIIVPSCAVHNQEKSNADEYLKFILTSSADGVPEEAMKGTVRSIVRNALSPKASVDRYGIERTEEGIRISGSAPVDEKLLEEALAKVARGVYYHHHGGLRKLVGEVVVMPIFLGIVDDAPTKVRDLFDSATKLVAGDIAENQLLGDHPDVFSYHVIENARAITVNMVFYRTKVVSVIKRVELIDV
ncbi:hypothetical protein [Stenotrophomonas sp. BIGb0135]|uniref:hypothetical protein n=1 Tax=Stenotrophomonas sp. BIGb0135 TaxID=2940620 RepID=UPI002169A215|nr:hypothetical protein [Stenotrophomonas sp. BIGb0135]MCS4234958.1 hypothetical protein [Stenotrophomonas sp. BIGb0135]